jgi:hypothetical protein
MQAFGPHDMGFDQRVQRLQHGSAGAHLIGQRRQADRDAFPAEALALPVQGLVLTELVDQDHGQQAGTGPGAGSHEREPGVG